MSGVGEGDTNEPVVVDKYTQTRQRWLKGKIVKSSHGRRYKRASTVPRTEVEKKTGEEHERKNRVERKWEIKKKGKDKKENKKQKKDNTVGMHQ